MILLALDVDGTLDVSGGPVSVAALSRMQLMDACWDIVIVSPSVAGAGLPFPRVLGGGDRLRALYEAASRFTHSARFYLSDNEGDDHLAREAGFVYVHPDDFHLSEKSL